MIAFIAGLALVLPHPPNVATGVGHVPVDHRVAIVRPWRAKLLRMARCESGGRWHLATGNGFYGGLQFTASTWRAVGGRGLPNWWSRLEQMFRAVRWHDRIGTWVTTAGWPVCGWR